MIFGKAINIGGGQQHDYYINHRGALYGIGYAGPRYKEEPDWSGVMIPIDDWKNGIGLDF